MPRGVVVFDGDDTLWFVEHLYDEARDAARLVVSEAGLDDAQWERIERECDLDNVLTMGVDPSRFPLSCVQAYEVLASSCGVTPDADVIGRVQDAARQVFRRPARGNEHATTVLDDLRTDYTLALLTKGAPEIQAKRISDADLAGSFDHVMVVPHKGAAEFGALLDKLDAEPASAWSVGNSLPSDINPALALGMAAIWIDAHVWEHERREVHKLPGALVATSLSEVPDLVRSRCL